MISRGSIFSMAAVLGILMFGVQVHADKKTESVESIKVSDAFVRTPVPGRNNTAGLFTLHNPTSQAITLVAVHADFAGRAELDSHSLSVGMIRMRKELPEVGCGEFTCLDAGNAAVLAMLYRWRNRSALFVHNFAPERRKIKLDLNLQGDAGRMLTNVLSDDHSRADAAGKHALALEPYAYRWYRIE
jgi:hypothetical protein